MTLHTRSCAQLWQQVTIVFLTTARTLSLAQLAEINSLAVGEMLFIINSMLQDRPF